MKRVLVLLLALIMVLPLVGCGKKYDLSAIYQNNVQPQIIEKHKDDKIDWSGNINPANNLFIIVSKCEENQLVLTSTRKHYKNDFTMEWAASKLYLDYRSDALDIVEMMNTELGLPAEATSAVRDAYQNNGDDTWEKTETYDKIKITRKNAEDSFKITYEIVE